MTIFSTFTRNGQRYYLIPDNYQSKQAALETITRKQNKQREYKNVAMNEYRGRKYPNCIYIVEG